MSSLRGTVSLSTSHGHILPPLHLSLPLSAGECSFLACSLATCLKTSTAPPSPSASTPSSTTRGHHRRCVQQSPLSPVLSTLHLHLPCNAAPPLHPSLLPLSATLQPHYTVLPCLARLPLSCSPPRPASACVKPRPLDAPPPRPLNPPPPPSPSASRWTAKRGR